MTVFTWNSKTYDTAYLSSVPFAYLVPTLSGAGNTSPWIFAAFEDALVEAGLRATGGAGGYLFNFDTAVAAADPGQGKIRFSDPTLSNATAAYVDVLQTGGSDISAWLASMAGAAAIKGDLTIRSLTTNTKFASWTVTAVTNSTGYYTLTLGTYTGPTPAPTFTAGEALGVTFGRAGPAGSVSAASDGTVSAPGMSFASESGLGIRRKGTNVAAVTAAGADLLELRPATQAEAEGGANTLAVITPQRLLQGIRKNTVGNVGGQTVTGDVTLTVASAGAIIVNPSAPGFFATLPAATTMNIAGPGIFSLYNAGDFDYGVRDNAGTRLGWIPPRGSVVIDAVDISTAAGVWGLDGIEKLGVTAQFMNAAVSNFSAIAQTIDMGSGKTLFLLGDVDLYGLVHDNAARSWGSLTLIRSGTAAARVAGVQTVAGTQALVCSVDTATSTAFQAVVLTISGTSITVNTPASVTLAGVSARLHQMAVVGTSFLVSYGRATSITGLRAITISGTTPTIGAESIVNSVTESEVCRLYVSGSIVRTVTALGTTVQAVPYTVSGTTLTVGTSASATISATDIRTLLNSNGNIVALYNNSGFFATIFKLTGTTEAASTVSMGVGSYTLSSTDAIDLGSGKTLVTSPQSASTGLSVNILTDTAGTASAGTAYSFSSGLTNNTGPICLYAGGGSARVGVGAAPSSTAWSWQYSFNVSGASPTLSAVTQTQDMQYSIGNVSNRMAVRSPYILRAGQTAYAIAASGTAFAGPATIFAAGNVISINRHRSGVRSALAAGFNDFESWFGSAWANGTVGLVIIKLECAA